MSAVLYYRYDAPVLSDAEYDKLTREVAAGWYTLSEFRQWTLGGSKADFEATGFHLKITRACLGGALMWRASLSHPAAASRIPKKLLAALPGLAGVDPARHPKPEDWKPGPPRYPEFIFAGSA